MSSHHIVRDKQEPALLIIDLTDFQQENLGQLLEWSPTVVVVENEYERVDSLGIKVDVLVSAKPFQGLQESTLHVLSNNESLQDALRFLVGQQYPSVNIIDKNFCAKDYALYVGRIDLVVLTPTQRIFPINSGFGKWKAAGEEIKVLQEVKNLRTSGLINEQAHKFRTEKDGFYTLSFDQAFTFIAESI